MGLDAQGDAALPGLLDSPGQLVAARDSESSRLSSSKWTPGKTVTWPQSQAAAYSSVRANAVARLPAPVCARDG